MKALMTKRLSLVLIFALVFVLAFGMVFAVTDGVANADSATRKDSIGFVHMSDIHYFPLDCCYTDVKAEDYATSEFYHSTTGDTKLVLESGIILNKAVHSIIENVKAGAKAGTAPMYFIATGDLSKNGERKALIDVANALRFMQNEIRKIGGKYANFQVFAQVGNHDLYNTDAALYSQKDGKALIADIVTAEQFAMIFAGLGFPNANLDGSNGALDLTSYLPAEYWSSDYTSGYQASSIASNLEIHYYSPALEAVNSATTSAEKLEHYFAIGDGLNQLSYSVEIKDNDFGFLIFDSSDREETDAGSPVRLNMAEYNYLPKTQTYYVGTDDGSIDMSKTLTASQATSALSDGKAVYRAAKYAHITGGRLTEDVLNWAEKFATAQHKKASFGGEKTLFAAFHHNILPHFESEDDILKEFTLYNWEYTAKRMLSMGVRYVFTGHQHSSDTAAYTDIEGRTLYDSETGSMVSYESPRRYMTVTRYDAGGKLAEEAVSSIDATDDMKETASSHIDKAAKWDQAKYDAAISAYKNSPTPEKWQAVLASNPDYVAYIVAYDRLSTRNYNEYIGEEIYTCLVERVLAHFLTQDTVDGLLNTVDSAIAGLSLGNFDNMIQSLTGISMGANGSLRGIVNYLLDVIVYGLYPDTDNDSIGNYPYKDKTYNGILDWLTAIVNDLVDMSFGDDSIVSTVNQNNKGKMNLKEMAGFIMMAHATGQEVKLVTTQAELEAEYAAIADKFSETPAGNEDFRFKSPTDATYRKRMTAAVKDAHEQLISGKFANDLFNALLDPLFNNDNSLIRRLMSIEIDLSKAVDAGYLSKKQYQTLSNGLEKLLPNLLSNSTVKDLLSNMLGLVLPEGYALPSMDAAHFSIGFFINSLLPIAKPLVADLIGFNLVGDDLISILQNAIEGYITRSFKVGLGGIADEIIIAYATDVFPDLTDIADPSVPFVFTPYDGYAYSGKALSYLDGLQTASQVGADFNAATKANGRVPSRVTANFDTKDSTGSYTFKFYTAEDVYGRFKFKSANDGEWTSVTTSLAQADETTDYNDSVATYEKDGVKVEMLTQTRPAYVPLIDLGLVALTHAQIVYEDEKGKELPILYGKNGDGYWRDSSAGNSVIYWNVTTVTISGLKADTKYCYDLEGVYVTDSGSEITFSLSENAGKDCYTFKTGADRSKENFEFLAISDIQGMIDAMYKDSHKAVEALLADARTKNFDFILNAGDMVDNGKNFRQWGMALDTYEDLFAGSSQFFTAGNHEDGKNAFETYFNYTLPTDDGGQRLQEDITSGAFYSFDYGNAHFTVLNTNDASENGLGEVQTEWLKKDLTSTDAKWKFVLMHKSVFSGGSHSYDAEVVGMREQLVPLFAENGVNIVFAGHDHTFTTTKLIASDGSVVDNPSINGVRYRGDGVLYITLGTLGTKFYEYAENGDVTPKFDDDSSILSTLTSQTFGKVEVTADEIVFTGYRYDPNSGKLSVIGDEIVLSVDTVMPATTVYIIIGVVVSVVVIAAAIAIFLVLRKKKALRAPQKAETLSTDAGPDAETPEDQSEARPEGEPGDDPEQPALDPKDNQTE